MIQEQEPYSTSEIQNPSSGSTPWAIFPIRESQPQPGPSRTKSISTSTCRRRTPRRSRSAAGTTAIVGLRQLRLGNSNLFGGGEAVSANAQIGFLYQNYSVSYTEPWFLDIPLSVTVQVFYNKLYLFSFDQTNRRLPDQYELSADRTGIQENRAVVAGRRNARALATSSRAWVSAGCPNSPPSISRVTRATPGYRR